MKISESKNLYFIWLTLGIEIVVLSLIKPFVIDFESVSLFAVSMHSLIVLLILGTLPIRNRAVYVFAFIARLLFMLWDIYARDIFLLPNSGRDTEMFYHMALKISDNLSLLNDPVRGGIYAKLIGLLFNFIGPQRIFAQYINVIIGLMIVFLVFKILCVLELNLKIIERATILTAFFPNSIVMSAIFLREIIPTFFVAISLYHFISWYKWRSNWSIIVSLIMLSIASIFHSGIIGVFIGYSFFYMFYKKEVNRFRFGFHTIIAFFIVGSVAYLITSKFGDSLFIKFGKISKVEDVLETANQHLGNSTYLTGIEINNSVQLILFGPLKMFFFLTSPLPINWRGLMDVFTFLFDSSLYFFTILYLFRNWIFFNKNKPLLIGIILTLLGVVMIFGVGVNNAGTAVRHRQKILPITVVLLAVMMNEKRNFYIDSNLKSHMKIN